MPRPRRPRIHATTKALRALIRKLFEKAQIVFEKQPDVLHPVAQDGHALDADPPCESGVALRIVAHRFEYRGMDHPAAEDLDPAGPLAHRASRAVALPAADED